MARKAYVQPMNGDGQCLTVIKIDNEEFYVENSDKKTGNTVTLSVDEVSCSCDDFIAKVEKDPNFKCAHILAAMNAGEVLEVEKKKPLKLDERFIKNIQGRDFVVYAGVLDLAHQRGLSRIEVEAIQYPSDQNGNEAICKATVETDDGDTYIEWGDANPKNVNPKVVRHILRMAATRAKARALRDMTNIGMTTVEELGDLDEVIGDDNNTPPPKKPGAKKPAAPSEKPEETAPKDQPRKGSPNKKSSTEPPVGLPSKISTAQQKAIENLTKRRGITSEELKALLKEHYGTLVVDALTSQEASTLIRQLQQSA